MTIAAPLLPPHPAKKKQKQNINDDKTWKAESAAI